MINDEIKAKMWGAAEIELERTGIPEEADEDFCNDTAERVIEALIKDGVIEKDNEDTHEIVAGFIQDLCDLCDLC